MCSDCQGRELAAGILAWKGEFPVGWGERVGSEPLSCSQQDAVIEQEHTDKALYVPYIRAPHLCIA